MKIGGYPKWVYLQLTNQCNLRCKMCYEWGETGLYSKMPKQELSFETIESIVKDCLGSKPLYWLYGGEPMVHRRYFDIIELIKKNDSKVETDTNGTLLHTNYKELVDSGIDNIHISLDGPQKTNDEQRGQGVFENVMDGIKKIYGYRELKNSSLPKISVNTIITLTNYNDFIELFTSTPILKWIDGLSIELQTFITKEELEKYKSFIKKEFEVDSVDYAHGFLREFDFFSDVNLSALIKSVSSLKELCQAENVKLNTFPNDFSSESIEGYYNQQYRLGKNKKCLYPWLFAEITSAGLVSPCHAFYDLTFGNVNSKPFLEIWHSEEYQKFRNLMKKQSLAICRGCCLWYNQNQLMT